MKGYNTIKRYNMYQVMNNTGFGGVKIIKNDFELFIPTTLITKRGYLKKSVKEAISNKNIAELKGLGITVILKSKMMA